jgi:hypothetical protein
MLSSLMRKAARITRTIKRSILGKFKSKSSPQLLTTTLSAKASKMML